MIARLKKRANIESIIKQVERNCPKIHLIEFIQRRWIEASMISIQLMLHFALLIFFMPHLIGITSIL